MKARTANRPPIKAILVNIRFYPMLSFIKLLLIGFDYTAIEILNILEFKINFYFERKDSLIFEIDFLNHQKNSAWILCGEFNSCLNSVFTFIEYIKIFTLHAFNSIAWGHGRYCFSHKLPI